MFILDKNVVGGIVVPKMDGNAFGGWYVATGSTNTWHRMSNGDLVSSTDALQGTAALLSNGGIGSVGYADIDGSGTIPVGNKNIRRMYSDCAIDGGTYRFKLMRIGAATTHQPGDEFAKYVAATGLAEWGLTRPLVEGVESGANYYWSRDPQSGALGTYYATSPAAARIYGVPTGAAPTITPEQTALGIITDPTSVTLQLVGSPAVTASWDGQQAETVQTNVGSVTIDLADKWESLSYGSHTIIVRSSQGGYQCGAMITFSKSSSVVEVVTTPHLTIERPTMVKVVGDLLVPSGAELTVDVSNNAGDDSPQWEPCDEDMTHYFANATKTADQWGLAVRIGIDNSDGESNAEIRNSIAAGVIYDREA